MPTIWKFSFETRDGVMIDMPEGAEILSLQLQNGMPTIWALVHPERRLAARWFRIYGTGHPIDMEMEGEFIGTYQLAGGALVFHVFEVPPSFARD